MYSGESIMAAAKVKEEVEPKERKILTAAEKLTKVNKIIDDTNKKWVRKGVTTTDRPIVGTMAKMASLHGPMIPTGIRILDYKLGGGFTRGCATLLWGNTGGGKSSLAMITAATVIKAGGIVLWIQTEPGDLPAIARIHGIDINDPHFIHQDVLGSGEMAIEILQAFCMDEGKPSDLVDLVVLDSIANLSPKEEIENVKKDGFNDVGGGMALPERMMSKIFRLLHATRIIDKAHMIFISQSRVSLGDYGTPDKPKGGRATVFNVRLNMKLSPVSGESGLIRVGGKETPIIGHKYKIKLIKDGISMRSQNYEFEEEAIYGKGLNAIQELYFLLTKESPAFRKAGSWFYATPELALYLLENKEWKFNSEASLRAELTNNERFRTGCDAFLMDYCKTNPDSIVVELEDSVIESPEEELSEEEVHD
jgi:RecA/RadA recombinase